MKRYSKSAAILFAAALFALGSLEAEASLIGDTVHVETIGFTVSESVDVVVGAGIEIEFPFDSFFQGEYLDITGDSIIGNFLDGFSANRRIEFSDLDWIPGPGFITGISVSSSWSGFGMGSVSFTADSVTLDFTGTNGAGMFEVFLQKSSRTPEPVTPALLLLGIAGARLVRRRRSA